MRVICFVKFRIWQTLNGVNWKHFATRNTHTYNFYKDDESLTGWFASSFHSENDNPCLNIKIKLTNNQLTNHTIVSECTN